MWRISEYSVFLCFSKSETWETASWTKKYLAGIYSIFYSASLQDLLRAARKLISEKERQISQESFDGADEDIILKSTVISSLLILFVWRRFLSLYDWDFPLIFFCCLYFYFKMQPWPLSPWSKSIKDWIELHCFEKFLRSTVDVACQKSETTFTYGCSVAADAVATSTQRAVAAAMLMVQLWPMPLLL